MTSGSSPDLPPRTASETPSETSPATAGKAIQVAVAAVWRWAGEGERLRIEVLAARRHAGAIRGGLWELPGGKIEHGESPVDAARREVAEETGITLAAVEPLGEVEHHDRSTTQDLRGEAKVRLHAVLAQVASTIEAKPLASAECRWIGLDEFDRYAWPPANAGLNAALLERLRSIAAARGATRRATSLD